MKTRKIKLRIELLGKAPAKYGANAYKVSLAERGILVRSGWTHAGSGRYYEYVSPPVDGRLGRQVVVDVEVPTDDEIRALAVEMHQARKPAVIQIGGFVAKYQPSGIVLYTRKATGVFGGDGEPPTKEWVERSDRTEFEIGLMSPWSVKLVWECGDDAEPFWYRDGNEDGT